MQFSMLSDNTEHNFRQLYYHLYSNSTASRSERILSDLSKLIMASISHSNGQLKSEVSLFLNGNGTANSIILPGLVKEYPTSVGVEDKFSLDDNALRHSFNVLQKIDLKSNPSHTFGDAFQALMGPRLRGDKGQFFTPRSVVRAMVEMLAPTPGTAVIDPACGTGGFLSAVLDFWRGREVSGTVVGIDKDSDLALLASALSVVHSDDSTIKIHNANSLSFENLAQNGVELGKFDYVLTNPPFGAKIGITDKHLLSSFDLGHEWDVSPKGWCKSAAIRSTQDPQVLFIELCVRLLKDEGKLGIVLPEGVFGNKKSGYIWDYLRQNGEIEALIDCPRTTFQPGTDTKTNILFFKKTRKASTECWVSVAYHCGHDKRGKSVKADGSIVQDDFSEIAKDWHLKPDSRTIWNKISIEGAYYLVPRYYDRRTASSVHNDAERLDSGVVSLGELVKAGVVTIRKGHEVGSEAYGSGEIPFVRTSDIHNFEISYDPTNCVSEDIYREYAPQQKLKAGDIFMVVDGRYKIGRCAILHEWSTRCIAQSHLRIISLSSKARFNPMALLYALSLPSVQREIRRLVFIQSTLGGLGSRIEEIRIPDPRQSGKWGDILLKFEEAVAERARHSAYLQSFGHEVEL